MSLTGTLQKLGWPSIVMIFFVPGAVLLWLPGYRPDHVPIALLFLGRLHPLVLHFPIVLILLAVLLEIARYIRIITVAEGLVAFILFSAALSTVVSIVAGYLLFVSGDYAGLLIEQHLWAGAITGFLMLFTLGLYVLRTRYAFGQAAYRLALVLTSCSVGFASHLGGSVTHGQDYLTEHLRLMLTPDERDDRLPEEMLVYEDIIRPVLEAKCFSCHNSMRSKGGLTLTSFEGMLRTGDSGKPCIVPGDTAGSEMLVRVNLPVDDQDRMPPEGKSPLKADELSILSFWIATGASRSVAVADVVNDTVRETIARMTPELVKYRRNNRTAALNRVALEEELTAIGEELAVIIAPDSTSDEDFFAMAMRFPPAPFSNEQFRVLRPYYDAFSKLSLVGSGIDDAGLYYIGQMRNVRALYLQKTNLNGSGLVYLQNMPSLEELNLSFTAVNDQSVLDLLKIPRLRRVYLYRTNTTKAVLEALRKNRPGLELLVEEGPYF